MRDGRAATGSIDEKSHDPTRPGRAMCASHRSFTHTHTHMCTHSGYTYYTHVYRLCLYNKSLGLCGLCSRGLACAHCCGTKGCGSVQRYTHIRTRKEMHLSRVNARAHTRVTTTRRRGAQSNGARLKMHRRLFTRRRCVYTAWRAALCAHPHCILYLL